MKSKWTVLGLALLSLRLVSGAQQNPSPTASTQSATQDRTKASISGSVLKAGGGEPVRRATITLRVDAADRREGGAADNKVGDQVVDRLEVALKTRRPPVMMVPSNS
jgi:hypothetical protein